MIGAIAKKIGQAILPSLTKDTFKTAGISALVGLGADKIDRILSKPNTNVNPQMYNATKNGVPDNASDMRERYDKIKDRDIEQFGKIDKLKENAHFRGELVKYINPNLDKALDITDPKSPEFRKLQAEAEKIYTDDKIISKFLYTQGLAKAQSVANGKEAKTVYVPYSPDEIKAGEVGENFYRFANKLRKIEYVENNFFGGGYDKHPNANAIEEYFKEQYDKNSNPYQQLANSVSTDYAGQEKYLNNLGTFDFFAKEDTKDRMQSLQELQDMLSSSGAVNTSLEKSSELNNLVKLFSMTNSQSQNVSTNERAQDLRNQFLGLSD